MHNLQSSWEKKSHMLSQQFQEINQSASIILFLHSSNQKYQSVIYIIGDVSLKPVEIRVYGEAPLYSIKT